MIGQDSLLARLNIVMDAGKFPRFSLFIGSRGSGKRTIMRQTANRLAPGSVVEYGSTSVDDVRSMIQEAYRIVSQTAYIMPDIHAMSAAAKNSMLKVTEEPPNNAYFLMSSTSYDGVPETIRGRSMTYQMLPYSTKDKMEFMRGLDRPIAPEHSDFALSISETLDDIRRLSEIDIGAFRSYVDDVFGKIASVSGPSSFRLADKLALKNEADGDKFDLELFFQAFQEKCIEAMSADDTFDSGDIYSKYIEITSQHLSDLRIKGVSRQMLIDDWVLRMRRA